MPGSLSTSLASFRAMAKTMSFSLVPLLPTAPLSLPPCPASIAITISRRGCGLIVFLTLMCLGLVTFFAGFGFEITVSLTALVDVTTLVGAFFSGKGFIARSMTSRCG